MTATPTVTIETVTMPRRQTCAACFTTIEEGETARTETFAWDVEGWDDRHFHYHVGCYRQ